MAGPAEPSRAALPPTDRPGPLCAAELCTLKGLEWHVQYKYCVYFVTILPRYHYIIIITGNNEGSVHFLCNFKSGHNFKLQKSCKTSSRNSPICFTQVYQLFTFAPFLKVIPAINVHKHTVSFSSGPFERKWKITKYFTVYFLRTRSFSYKSQHKDQNREIQD